MSEEREEPDRIVFTVAIPLTSQFTKLSHKIELLDEWFLSTTELEMCRGGSVVATSMLGLWWDPKKPPEKNPVEDYSNWYQFAVLPDRIDDFRKHIEVATGIFEQECIYLARTGEASLVMNPSHPPPSQD